MEETRNCRHCGKTFLIRKQHHNQRYCCRECRTQAQSERDENRKFGNNHKFSILNQNSCRDLWKQYFYYKKMMWIPDQARIERKLRDKGCWFKRKLHLTKEEREFAEKREKEIA